MDKQIVAGDWLVGGVDAEDLDYGRIVSLEGDVAMVAWESGVQTTCELGPDDVEVYSTKAAAAARFAERRAANPPRIALPPERNLED